ncbi:MAG: DUF1326 domain-containing protein [Gemmatimonadetes bacterium]|nr:DUF1326 domain-containing protein [Gemmatimonadota bacterium]
MSREPNQPPRWWAKGLLFENCCCQVVCPGHVHFDQLCTLERCNGYWAVRFDEGEFDGVRLDGLAAVIAYDSPQHMIQGNWTEALIIDEAATGEQRTAIESILNGSAGGPWSKLAPFVSTWLETRYHSIRIEEQEKTKAIVIEGLLEGTIEQLRGRDGSQPVTFENMFNQIHATSQVIATGSTKYNDGVIAVDTDGTHSLYSNFSWSVS